MGSTKGLEWSPAELALVTRECAKGESCSNIAAAIKKELGMTRSRNAVIGVVTRRGIYRPEGIKKPDYGRQPVKIRMTRSPATISMDASVPRPPRPVAAKRDAPVIAPDIVPAPKRVDTPLADSVGVDLMALGTGQCKYILGSTVDGIARFCGDRCRPAPRGRFHPYCPGHIGRLVITSKPAAAAPAGVRVARAMADNSVRRALRWAQDQI